MPQLPQRLGDLTPARVTQEMNKWSQWLAYIKSELALSEIRHREADDHFKKRMAVLMIEQRHNASKKIPITVLKAEIEVGEEMLALHEKERVLDAKRKLLEAIYEGADQNHKTLSRELTRRTNVYDRGLE
jgi:16S rRNA G1207 methylase RsmC